MATHDYIHCNQLEASRYKLASDCNIVEMEEVLLCIPIPHLRGNEASNTQ